MLADVVDHHDVPTGWLRGRERLRLKPRAAVRPDICLGIEQLDRDRTAQLQIPAVTHLGHRTAA